MASIADHYKDQKKVRLCAYHLGISPSAFKERIIGLDRQEEDYFEKINVEGKKNVPPSS